MRQNSGICDRFEDCRQVPNRHSFTQEILQNTLRFAQAENLWRGLFNRLRQLRPRYYVKGSDWRDRLPAEQVTICQEHGIEIVYLDTVRDSSSRILKDYCAEQGGR